MWGQRQIKDEPVVFMHFQQSTRAAFVFVRGVDVQSTCILGIKIATLNEYNMKHMRYGCFKVETNSSNACNSCKLNKQIFTGMR